MRELGRILCPVDLSDTAGHVVQHAVQFGRWYRAPITALHICNPVVIPPSDFTLVGAPTVPILTDDDINEVRQKVQTLFDSTGSGPVDVIVESGRPAKRIVEIAGALPAGLIVMGTHGATGFQHLILGSVTEKVLRQAPCPVLTVPPRVRTTPSLPFTRILCPVDFSESARAALGFAVSLSQECSARLTILYALERPSEELSPFTAEYRHEVEQSAAAKLAELSAGFEQRGSQAVMRVAYGKAYREILATASEESSDLIVIGVHGRNPLDLMLFGSTTNQVVRRATCPVLTVRH